jgi:hypothetical protein
MILSNAAMGVGGHIAEGDSQRPHYTWLSILQRASRRIKAAQAQRHTCTIAAKPKTCFASFAANENTSPNLSILRERQWQQTSRHDLHLFVEFKQAQAGEGDDPHRQPEMAATAYSLLQNVRQPCRSQQDHHIDQRKTQGH